MFLSYRLPHRFDTFMAVQGSQNSRLTFSSMATTLEHYFLPRDVTVFAPSVVPVNENLKQRNVNGITFKTGLE